MKAALASRNANKLRELAHILEGWELSLLDANDYPPEAGATYHENARTKALFGRSIAPPEAWVLGEDSGIEVEGLGNRPGVESARSGGDDPVGWLLTRLENVAGDGRRARYVCELVSVSPDGVELRGGGVLEGRIGERPAGEEGFGYDPIFIPAGEERTVAELGNAWKRENSHRARAASALLAALTEARRSSSLA